MTFSNDRDDKLNQPTPEALEFIGSNLEALAGLAGLADLAEGFTLGFVECPSGAEINWVIEGLRRHPLAAEVQIETIELNDPNLVSLCEALVRVMPTIDRSSGRDLVLVVTGLEAAIGIGGEFTAFISTLNFERDLLAKCVPYPIVLMLPDYAMTRIARYAVDFWAWSSGRFEFKYSRASVEVMRSDVFNPVGRLSSELAPVKRERITLLEQLLMDCAPSGREIAVSEVGNCLNILLELGDGYRSLSNFAKSRLYYQQALDLSREHADRKREAQALRSLGFALPWWDHGSEAQRYYEQALSINLALGDRLGEANTLEAIGDVLQFKDQRDEALSNYRSAIDIYREVGDRLGEANTLKAIGDVLQFKKQTDEALSNYRSAIDIYREVGARLGEANCLQELGNLQEDIDQKLHFFQQAQQIYIAINDQYSQSRNLRFIARAYESLSNQQAAIQSWIESRDIAISINYESFQTSAQEAIDRLSGVET